MFYGHSTEQDFRHSFVGSDRLAPLFKRWICFCYNCGDVVLTPTPYARGIFAGLRPQAAGRGAVQRRRHPLFCAKRRRGAAFRQKYGLPPQRKAVVSAGHFMQRKGIFDFIALARALPQAEFFWFGYTEPALVPAPVRRGHGRRPGQLHFPGFVSQADLRDAYCGADLFCFCSEEETEGIVVLEALACGVPVLVRDIPVYAGWLRDGENVYKAAVPADWPRLAGAILSGALPDVTAAGRRVAEARALPRLGQQLCEVYRTLGPARPARPGRLPLAE